MTKVLKNSAKVGLLRRLVPLSTCAIPTAQAAKVGPLRGLIPQATRLIKYKDAENSTVEDSSLN